MKSCKEFVRTSLLVAVCALSAQAEDNWPNWRGPDNQGRVKHTELPMEWSADKNVIWKLPLPDRGNSTPVVWGNKIFLTQAIEKEGKRELMAVDFRSGKTLWTRGIVYKEPETTHRTNPYCSASPVVDGEKVIALFGSGGIHCWNHQGEKLWEYQPGKQTYAWGNGSSPILWNNLCIFYFGPGPNARLIALDAKTGDLKWEYLEPEHKPAKRTDGFRGNQNGMVCTYSSPVAMQFGKQESIVMLFPGFIRGIDPSSGKLQWESPGLNPLVYASPASFGNRVVGMGGYMGTTTACDISGETFSSGATPSLWQDVRTKNRLGSPVIVNDTLGFVLNTPGTLEAFDPKSGRQLWEERLPAKGPTRESWSSITLAGDKLYCFNQAGDTIIVKAASEFQVLSVNGIGNELTNSSPVILRDRLLLRSHKFLWCFGNPNQSL